jgi:uncharacterized protein (DUF2345 family)
VLVRGGGVWSLQQEVTASDGAAGDYFGAAAAVSGNTMVIGASGRNSNQGAAYVFVRSGAAWSLQQKLTASDGAASDNFSISVAVSGNTAVIGASGKNNYQGVAYVFASSGGVWTQQQELSDGVSCPGFGTCDEFGNSVAVSGNTAAIGTINSNGQQGAVYVFTASGGVWSRQQELTASDASNEDFFGSSVAVSGNTVVIGAQGKNNFQGAAYVFAGSGGVWSQQQELTASDGAYYDSFGE